MANVEAIMSTDLLQVGPQAALVETAKAMDERRVGAVLVFDRDRLVGIFTERDLLRGWRAAACPAAR